METHFFVNSPGHNRQYTYSCIRVKMAGSACVHPRFQLFLKTELAQMMRAFGSQDRITKHTYWFSVRQGKKTWTCRSQWMNEWGGPIIENSGTHLCTRVWWERDDPPITTNLCQTFKMPHHIGELQSQESLCEVKAKINFINSRLVYCTPPIWRIS